MAMPTPQELAGRRFLFALVVVSLLAVAYVAWPLATALLLAAVFAVVLAPVQERFTRWVGGRRGVAAGILVVAVLFLVVGPLLGLIERLPGPLDEWARRALERLGDLGQLAQKHATEQGGRAASAVAAAVVATGGLVFDLVMMLIALFFLLVSGKELVGWLDTVSPLRPGQTRELLNEFKKVSYAVIVATVVTAGVQAIVAFVGYLITRVPHPVFFGTLTFFIALIPAIGAAGVCLFAALILLATGHPYMALFLAVWGLVVVGLIDNVVKPFLIKGELEMGGAVVFFALIGGIAAFGMAGLIIGPLAVALFLTLVRMYRRDFIS